MRVLDAVEIVLRESGKPLQIKDITKRILSGKLREKLPRRRSALGFIPI